jgi:hypothetical protein
MVARTHSILIEPLTVQGLLFASGASNGRFETYHGPAEKSKVFQSG